MKLPPWTAVRVFESAARHGSMRRAAEELFVTAGAISQQVRLLEDHFGVQLLERRPLALLLTVVGQDFYSAVTRHLRGIAQAATQLAPRQQRERRRPGVTRCFGGVQLPADRLVRRPVAAADHFLTVEHAPGEAVRR